MFRVSFADTLTPIDAQRISRRAAALVNEQGRTRALSRFSKLDGGFLEKDGFVFCMTLAGVVVSHPVRPQLVGRNLLDHRRYGQYLFQDMVRVAKNTGEGWVEYNWPYPGTSKLRPKMSYVVRNKEGFLCSVAAFK
ncbi:MAG: histidine kinase [Proteobacteria bacterium]|nr:MAG: histidine kinase [Pseudomonadota bacterium]